MGADGYIWGREFLSTEPESPRQLVISKRWYSFMLWGRLSYDPDLPDSLFLKTIATRFPEAPAEQLSAAWSAASMVFPQITRFFWGDIDVTLVPRGLPEPPERGQGILHGRAFHGRRDDARLPARSISSSGARSCSRTSR